MPYVAKDTDANKNKPIKVDSGGRIYVISDNPADKYALYRYDADGDPIYLINEDKDGNWYAMRITTSTGVADYAAVSNNAGVTTASAAYTNRITLTYAARSGVTIT